MNTLVIALLGLAPFADEVPADSEVKAGWGAFAIFMLLAVAVAVLGFSLVRHLRKAKANADAGAFGPEDADGSPTD
jgi:hypothetical protein